MNRLSREELELGAAMYPPVDIPRPATRAECRDGMRPCPWVACKHHLYLDINPETGSIKINFPDLEPWELEHTCALDVAELDGITLEKVGEIMNLNRERIRQIETRGLIKLKMGSPSPDEFGSELLAGNVDVMIRKGLLGASVRVRDGAGIPAAAAAPTPAREVSSPARRRPSTSATAPATRPARKSDIASGPAVAIEPPAPRAPPPTSVKIPGAGTGVAPPGAFSAEEMNDYGCRFATLALSTPAGREAVALLDSFALCEEDAYLIDLHRAGRIRLIAIENMDAVQESLRQRGWSNAVDLEAVSMDGRLYHGIAVTATSIIDSTAASVREHVGELVADRHSDGPLKQRALHACKLATSKHGSETVEVQEAWRFLADEWDRERGVLPVVPPAPPVADERATLRARVEAMATRKNAPPGWVDLVMQDLAS